MKAKNDKNKEINCAASTFMILFLFIYYFVCFELTFCGWFLFLYVLQVCMQLCAPAFLSDVSSPGSICIFHMISIGLFCIPSQDFIQVWLFLLQFLCFVCYDSFIKIKQNSQSQQKIVHTYTRIFSYIRIAQSINFHWL